MPSPITSAGNTKPPYIHAIQFDGELHFKATGDGMKPTINPSDYYQGSGIYLIEANGLVQIRRLDRHRNGICIMTDNPIYENEIVPEHMFRVLAKADCVLKKCAA
ncbi:MAG: S24 family peptidase [Vitreoscilla sp.]|nr:S24 family peptidase [Vitreoscilla sp.]